MAARNSGDKKRVFGPYELGTYLRREGNFIEVFEAYDTRADEQVELRILKIPLKKTSDGLSERFGHEVDLLSRVDHPSIVRVIDVGEEQGFAYYTVKLVPNVTLNEHLDAAGSTLPIEDVLRFGEILTDALAVLHDKGLLHRGISTKSVFVDTAQGVPYFGECSVMKDIRARYGLSERGIPSLALYTNAPEMLTLEKWSPRTDVYQMCALMFRMLTGKTALPATIPAEHRKIYEDIVDVSLPGDVLACHGDLDGLDDVLLQGLQFASASRQDSATELRDALRAVARKRDIKLLLREELARAAGAAHARPREDPEERKRRRREEQRQQREANQASSTPRTERPLVWLGLAVGTAFGLVGFMIGTFSSPAPSAPSAPSPSSPPPPSASSPFGPSRPAVVSSDVRATALVKAFEATRTVDSQDERFRAQWAVLADWVKTQKHPIEGVGSHIDLLKLRMRYTHGDKAASAELETQVDRAVQYIRGDTGSGDTGSGDTGSGGANEVGGGS